MRLPRKSDAGVIDDAVEKTKEEEKEYKKFKADLIYPRKRLKSCRLVVVSLFPCRALFSF